jgi:8-oxo-dGTP pyrophosphatase MutT (NUDIX family)
MPTPSFVLELRRKVGNDLLLLPGLAAVVVDTDGRILLNRRSDTGNWSIISGIMEPGEQPETALEREVFEETGMTVRAVRLVDASTTPVVTYPNGDQSQYLTVAYRCDVVSGTPRVNDEESLEVRFFALSELPELRDDIRRMIDRAFEK